MGEGGGENLYGFVGNDGNDRVDLCGLFEIPWWIHRDVKVIGVKRLEETRKGYRLQSRTLAIWNSENDCCFVQNESKLDEGHYEIEADYWYYDPPPGFGTAYLEELEKKLIEMAEDGAAEKSLKIKAALELTRVTMAALEKSNPDGPAISDKAIVVGREIRKASNFQITHAGEWKRLDAGVLKGLTKYSCEHLSKITEVIR